MRCSLETSRVRTCGKECSAEEAPKGGGKPRAVRRRRSAPPHKRIRDILSEVRDHLCEDIVKINEPRAEALFETTAETLDGLITAFEDYERGQEEAWRDDA